MVELEFDYEQNKIYIQANLDEYFSNVINKYYIKSQLEPNSVIFMVHSIQIPENKRIFEVMNQFEKTNKRMYIAVFPLYKCDSNKNIIVDAKEIICPKCSEQCRIKVEDYMIKLYDCKNNHQTTIKLDEFKETQKIDLNKIKCNNCNFKSMGNTFNNTFYYCLNCRANLCVLCKSKHKKNHFIINYEQKDYKCPYHFDSYFKYCYNCKSNICMLCNQAHLNHKLESYENIISNPDNKRIELDKIKNEIDIFNKNVKKIINGLNQLIENMETYYNIFNNIFNNYNVNDKNYHVLKNINQINLNTNIYNEILQINKNKNNIDKINKIFNIYYKMQGKNNLDPFNFFNYDSNEKSKTVTRTIEDASEDYYMFRLGLNTLNDDEQKTKFLNSNGSSVSLPQYENSFYFYFGLKDGSTALDEFNKQFFSQCETKSVFMDEPKLTVNSYGSACTLTLGMHIGIDNMTSPASLTIKNKTLNKTILVGNNNVTGKTHMDFNYPEDVEGTAEPLTIGSYEITVVDADNQTITNTVNIGQDFIKTEVEKKDFEFKTKGLSDIQIISSGKTNGCGYIKVNNEFVVSGNTFNVGDGNNGVILVDEDSNYALTGVTKEQINQQVENIRGEGLTGTYYPDSVLTDESITSFYVWGVDKSYDLYLAHKCEGEWYAAYYGTYVINGIDNYDLYLGSKFLPYSTKLTGFTGMWENRLNTLSSDVNDCNNWAMRHALFRQTDEDGEYFTNGIIALDNNGKVIDTALFGQPEFMSSIDGKYYLSDSVYYEGDTEYFEGDVSDDSIISTNGDMSEDDFVGETGRTWFGEMALHNNVIASNKLITRTCNTVPSSIINKVVIENVFTTYNEQIAKVPNEHGCIVKLDDDTVLYTVRNGRNLEYYGEVPEITTQRGVSVYPLFYFPVIYRPFYADAYFLNWTNSRIVMTESGVNEEPTSQQDKDNVKVQLDIHNGITFKNKFTEGSSTTICNKEVTITTTQSDMVGIGGATETDNVRTFNDWSLETTGETVDSFSFAIKEGSPNLTKGLSPDLTSDEIDALNTPYKIQLQETSGELTNNFPTYINYKTDGYGFYVMTSDNDSSNAKYYICNDRSKMPVKATGIVAIKNNEMTLYVSGKYNEKAHEISKKNIVGENVVITIDIFGIHIPMYLSDDDETQQSKHISVVGIGLFINQILNITEDNEIVSRISENGVDVQFNYIFNANGDNYVDLIKWVNNNTVTSHGYEELPSFGQSIDPNRTVINENSFVIGVLIGDAGNKGSIGAVKVFPQLLKINSYVPPSEPSIEIEPEEVLFDADGGDNTILIKSTTDWKFRLVGDDTSWIKVKHESAVVTLPFTGSKNKYLTITADENTSTSSKIVSGIAETIATREIDGVQVPYSAITVFVIDGKEDVNYIEPGDLGTTFSNGGGNLTLNVTSNLNDGWTLRIINNTNSWLKFTDDSTVLTGNGNTVVTVKCNTNTTSSQKTATVVIDNYSDANKKEIIFGQEASEPQLIVSPLILRFPKTGDTDYISVTCNGVWDAVVENGVSWISINKSSDQIQVIVNPSNEGERTGTIKVSSEGIGDKAVQIIQEDAIVKYIRTSFVEPVNGVFSYQEGNGQIKIESNTSWKISITGDSSTWLKFQDTTNTTITGTGDSTIDIEVTKNRNESQRTGVLKIEKTIIDENTVIEPTELYVTQYSANYYFTLDNQTDYTINKFIVTTTDGETIEIPAYVPPGSVESVWLCEPAITASQWIVEMMGSVHNNYVSIDGIEAEIFTNNSYYSRQELLLRHGESYTITVRD